MDNIIFYRRQQWMVVVSYFNADCIKSRGLKLKNIVKYISQ